MKITYAFLRETGKVETKDEQGNPRCYFCHREKIRLESILTKLSFTAEICAPCAAVNSADPDWRAKFGVEFPTTPVQDDPEPSTATPAFTDGALTSEDEYKLIFNNTTQFLNGKDALEIRAHIEFLESAMKRLRTETIAADYMLKERLKTARREEKEALDKADAEYRKKRRVKAAPTSTEEEEASVKEKNIKAARKALAALGMPESAITAALKAKGLIS